MLTFRKYMQLTEAANDLADMRGRVNDVRGLVRGGKNFKRQFLYLRDMVLHHSIPRGHESDVARIDKAFDKLISYAEQGVHRDQIKDGVLQILSMIDDLLDDIAKPVDSAVPNADPEFRSAMSLLSRLKLGEEDLNRLMKFYAWLKKVFDGTVYRAVSVKAKTPEDALKSIDFNKLGVFWAYDERGMSAYWSDAGDGMVIYMKAKIDKSKINVPETLAASVMKPEEREINMNSSSVQIVGYKFDKKDAWQPANFTGKT